MVFLPPPPPPSCEWESKTLILCDTFLEQIILYVYLQQLQTIIRAWADTLFETHFFRGFPNFTFWKHKYMYATEGEMFPEA